MILALQQQQRKGRKKRSCTNKMHDFKQQERFGYESISITNSTVAQHTEEFYMEFVTGK